jgi:tetratricopeptide (TPR) repeat protein
MGFSVPKAKAALAQTPGGVDVQMALETLLNGGGSDGPQLQEEEQDGPVQNRTRDALRAGHQQDRPRHQPGSRTPQQQQQPANIQDQADKLLAQASEIGLNVLSKASLFWKEGRKVVVENVQKVVVDNVQKAVEDEGKGKQMNGRPKWMQERGGHDDDEEEELHANGDGGFKDDLSPVGERGREQPPPQADRPPPPEEEPVVDLFAPAPVTHQVPRTTPYVSPWRRGKPTSSTPSPAPVQGPQPTRALLSIPIPTLHQVRAHKTRGTELFKLGQFSGACEAYSAAIALLPEGHLLLVPLYTNRALGRLRVGDYAGTIEDAGGALGVVGTGAPPFVGSGEGGGWEDPCGRGVDLTDGWVKALKRRAEAWEGREKWDEARKDWETLLGANGVGHGVKGEAGRGVERCRRMIMGEGESRTKPQAKPKPKPKPASMKANNRQEPSQALQSLRASSQALESEEELKASLKDTVDARLMAWKGGKETNIRALLASLDTVLWEDIVKDMGGKVALSELVLEGQVKKRYMRAVGRVHPDKVSFSEEGCWKWC